LKRKSFYPYPYYRYIVHIVEFIADFLFNFFILILIVIIVISFISLSLSRIFLFNPYPFSLILILYPLSLILSYPYPQFISLSLSWIYFSSMDWRVDNSLINCRKAGFFLRSSNHSSCWRSSIRGRVPKNCARSR
jgi:hypothetical protein